MRVKLNGSPITNYNCTKTKMDHSLFLFGIKGEAVVAIVGGGVMAEDPLPVLLMTTLGLLLPPNFSFDLSFSSAVIRASSSSSFFWSITSASKYVCLVSCKQIVNTDAPLCFFHYCPCTMYTARAVESSMYLCVIQCCMLYT